MNSVLVVYKVINYAQSGTILTTWAIDKATGEIFASSVRVKNTWDVAEFVDRTLADFIEQLKTDGYSIKEVRNIDEGYG